MKYKLNIQKYIENPTFEEDMRNYQDAKKNRHNYNSMSSDDLDYPSRFISTTSLEVELTEEEYKKVKGEVIKVFE